MSDKKGEPVGLYQPIIDKIFLDKYEDRQPDGRFHPSSLSGCDRLAVYEVSDTERTDPPDTRNIRIMGTGTEFHDRIQAALLEAHPDTLVEVPVEYGLITGSADAIVPVADGYGYTADEGADVQYTTYELQELKSGGNWKMRSVRKEPDEQHVKQARIYYWALQHTGFLLDGIRIAYFGREDWDVIEHEVEPWTEGEGLEFEASVDSLQHHVEDETLPPRKPLDNKGNRYWLCRYCPFRTRCYERDGEYTRDEQ
jgi:hypothetical protein